ncbi:MAG: AbrB/MazE/SpoVT family DNA-binding domain-containing protein [Firmicutes bacterium]|nr:AbrB/MazE/SpoVT family DNA-binding domain-containing protein [Bacillota bacterium]
MKETGIIREVDELGRVVIPMELRKVLNINNKTPLEIFTEGSTIILRKYNPGCIFCENVNNVMRFKEKNICSECLEQIKNED